MQPSFGRVVTEQFYTNGNVSGGKRRITDIRKVHTRNELFEVILSELDSEDQVINFKLFKDENGNPERIELVKETNL